MTTGSNVQNKGLSWTDADVKIKYRLVGAGGSLPYVKPLPMAVVLLSPKDGVRQGTALTLVKLDKSKPFLNVDKDMEKVIFANAIDAVVYGRKTAVDSCPIYDRLFPDLPKDKYVLREYNFAPPGPCYMFSNSNGF